MIPYFYEIMLVISFLLTVVYVMMWKKHFDINITAIFIMTPIANFGYLVNNYVQDEYDLMTAMKIVYMGGVFLTFFITMCVINLCKLKIKKWMTNVLFSICAILYCAVQTIGYTGWFYKDVKVKMTEAGPLVVKQYGPLHSFFYFVIVLFFVIGFTTIIYSFIKRRQVSRSILYLLFIPETIAFVGFFGNRLIKSDMEIMPVAYVFAQIMYLFIIQRMTLYNVNDTVIETMVQTGETGFISVDFKHHFLGANGTAKRIIPELGELAVDQKIDNVPVLQKSLCHWIRHFEEDNSNVRNLYAKRDEENPDNDQMYIVNTNYLFDGNRKYGYQVFLTDDTKNQKYIALLDKYNYELEEEVDAKTQHIIEMHDNLIMSMATMVESRDNSTGGHIKRTSEGVRILIEEMKKDEAWDLSEEFCKDIIKAAPMHDLGKVAVDDAILRKPGRFTPEEFEIMKSHAAEGAKIVHEILKETDDESFKKVAENVAHYHHERMDGSGYPEGLKGDEIPLEARIMAIADVYDALVSKRVYKEKMSFEEADKIMMESMGKHFDKRLEPFYIKARPKLEEYYSTIE